MNNQHLDDIKVIKEMMERSSKVLSLSGLSGVVAGCAAIAGAAFAYFYLLRDPSLTDYSRMQEIMILLATAMVVLIISIGFGIFFSRRKTKKQGIKTISKLTLRSIYNLAIPLVAGGIFCLVFLFRGDVRIAVAGTLLFYGLALVNASKYTYEEFHYLGLLEIALGLCAAVFGRYGLLFWTLGFGVCHIIYGIIMYRKYDRCHDGHIKTE